MPNASAIQTPTAVGSKTGAFTGRSKLVSNVLFTWASQMIFFAAGFIMPRMIDRKLGQEVLGVWDFSWSLVTYFRLIEMGIASAVNRNVAKYWGVQDVAGVNRVVSSATCALLIAASLVVLATIAAVAILPLWFGTQLGEHLRVAQWSVFYLGIMLAVGTGLGAFNGVLTGCHRWELQSFRQSFWHFATVVGMLVALWMGAGLATLAAITCICQTLGQLTMVTLAYRVCPGLRVRRAFVDKKTIGELYVYSGKTLLPSLSAMFLNQTASLLILGQLGPSALAIFSRPRSLLQQIDSLQRKMSMVLTPTTSSLQSCGDNAEIKNLLVKSVRYSLYLVAPMVLLLTIFGGEVMRLWMGPAYANALIPAILACGFIGAAIQNPIMSMLEGLNAHGWTGLVQFFGSVVSLVLCVLALYVFQTGLVGMAIAVTLPGLLVNLIYVPWLGCRRIHFKLSQFFSGVLAGFWLNVLPFAICLVVARLLYRIEFISSCCLLLAGSILLAISYWRNVLPERLKNWARSFHAKAISITPFLRAKGSRGVAP